MREIQSFKEQPDPLLNPESRRIVEDLSGWRYEELWAGSAALVATPALRRASPPPSSGA